MQRREYWCHLDNIKNFFAEPSSKLEVYMFGIPYTYRVVFTTYGDRVIAEYYVTQEFYNRYRYADNLMIDDRIILIFSYIFLKKAGMGSRISRDDMCEYPTKPLSYDNFGLLKGQGSFVHGGDTICYKTITRGRWEVSTFGNACGDFSGIIYVDGDKKLRSVEENPSCIYSDCMSEMDIGFLQEYFVQT